MTKRWAIMLAFLIFLLPVTRVHAQPKELRPTTYVFGNYVLDLSVQIEGWHPQYRFGVANCSDQTLYCLTAKQSGDSLSLINVAWPKECVDVKIGDTWRTGNVETRVYGKRTEVTIGTPSPHSTGGSDIFFLASPQYPKTVYEYSAAQGITAIYNFVDGSLPPTNAPIDDKALLGALKLQLITFVPLGPCSS